MSFQSIRHLNSFKLAVSARRLVNITSIDVLTAQLPIGGNVLLLGGGSNMLFTQDYAGLVLYNQLRGIEITQDSDFYYLQVAGGENWHDLVITCAEQGIGGLENLALIPGTVGAAPVQNIGAYGLEFCDVCEHVEAYSLEDGRKRSFSVAECEFAYRDSLFKSQRSYFISSVRLKLSKQWQPILAYGELKAWASSLTIAPTPLQVANQVIAIRESKLPDPAIIPNVGSFFKNPLVSIEQAQVLKTLYPTMPQYPHRGLVKLAAGWLIDQLGLKGYSIGGAAVHQHQALVLINKAQATPDDVVKLAQYIRQRVDQHFSVSLEPEVNFIDAHGYSHLDKALSDV